jgi:hypothetical protein
MNSGSHATTTSIGSARLPKRLLRPAPNGATSGASGQSHPPGDANKRGHSFAPSPATALGSLCYGRHNRLSDRIAITYGFLRVTVVGHGISSSFAQAWGCTN